MIRHFWEEQRKTLINAFLIAGTAFFPLAGTATTSIAENEDVSPLKHAVPWIGSSLVVLALCGAYFLVRERFQWLRTPDEHRHREKWYRAFLLTGAFFLFALLAGMTLLLRIRNT